ncbi:MAG: hypothetical protein IJR49_04280, partial [Treponema sp.]|nr:hypothetical protein [Treponema sp.]
AERPIVSNISTSADSHIRLSWTLPENTEEPISTLLVFRDTKPITSYKMLENLVPVAMLMGNENTWQDNVNDYKDYYYAVIAITDGKRYDLIIPTMNSTVTSVHLRLPKKSAAKDVSENLQEMLYPEGSMRETPLPYIDIINEMKMKTLPISDKAKNEAKKLAKSKTEQSVPLDVHIFEEDLVSPDRGDDYLLFDVLRNTFIKKDYESSVKDLSNLLAKDIREDVRKRTQFYLGQSYYFSGLYSDALVSFLSLSNDYPALTKKWINSSLDFMELPD